MRDDMKKVISTPSKVGGHEDGKNRREQNILNKDPESLPIKESMRKKHRMHWSGKESRELWTPMKRFLNKNVGRPWNKVYSEICQHADSRSETGRRVREIVEHQVENPVFKEDGIVYYKPMYRSIYVELRRDELYVDPDDGLLKKYTKGRKYQYKYQVYDHLPLAEQVAIHADTYSTGHLKFPKHHQLEIRNGKLFQATWIEGKEHLKNHTPCTAAQAEREFRRYSPTARPYLWEYRKGWCWENNSNDYTHKLYAMIKRNLRKALKSDEPYIKRMAELVKEKESERNQVKPTIEEILVAKKHERKAV